MATTVAATRPGSPLAARVFMRKKQGERSRSSDEPVLITLDLVRPLFDMPIKDAALRLNLCPTALKSVCRKLGVVRWPFKQHRKSQQSERCPTPPPQPRPSLTLEPPSERGCATAALKLEPTLPGGDNFMRGSSSSGSGFSRASTPCTAPHFAQITASTKSAPADVVVPAATFSHALAPPQLVVGWSLELQLQLEHVAEMHESMFPSRYSLAATAQPARGDDLSFIAAEFDSPG
ncbi:hypothetical protein T484DRAFT_1981159 [Baffinella frigidus]|nr:hypothetical protein T484DRAFT_1981159 [Cryptophyta sp. CCMP2293]|mmetsp:Transcript_25213/g.58012  ORF Transcript_25213/g.58012 Transcript_25213/m.58012 type:complete len:234 (+) Transcript_25213:176-877(+)